MHALVTWVYAKNLQLAFSERFDKLKIIHFLSKVSEVSFYFIPTISILRQLLIVFHVIIIIVFLSPRVVSNISNQIIIAT